MDIVYALVYLLVCVIIFSCIIAMTPSMKTTAQKTALGVLSVIPGINIIVLLMVTLVNIIE